MAGDWGRSGSALVGSSSEQEIENLKARAWAEHVPGLRSLLRLQLTILR